MAEFTLEPIPTQKEIAHAARLLLKTRRERGNPRLREMAAEIGLHETDLSRMLGARLVRHWGYRRLSRVAKWAGVTIDALLGRPEGTTHVLEAAGARPRAVPVAVVDERDLFEIGRKIAEEEVRLRSELGHLLEEGYPDERRRAGKVEEIASVIGDHGKRMMGLRDMLRERTTRGGGNR